MLIANFTKGNEELTLDGLWMYDYGQKLQIKGLNLPEAFEVHFKWGNLERAKVIVGTTAEGISVVDIPNESLSQKGAITAYIYLSDGEAGETISTVTMYINRRIAPEGFETPEDVDLFHYTLDAVNEYVSQAKSAEEKASQKASEAENYASSAKESQVVVEKLKEAVYAQTNAFNEKVTDLVAQTKQQITEHVDQEIARIDTAASIKKNALDESIKQADEQNAELKKTLSDAEELNTEIGLAFQNVKEATESANKAASEAEATAEIAQEQAAAAKEVTEILKKQINHIAFTLDKSDGGLNVVYIE